MKAVLNQQNRQVVKVKNLGGTLTTSAPITLKNQIIQIMALENINNVQVVNLANNATLIYNPQTSFYEIKNISYDMIVGDIDCGTF